MSYVTPWSGELEEGTYIIEMPFSFQIGIDIYEFKQWEDGSTGWHRTINLIADMAITATYSKVTHILTVESTPISGVNFTIKEASKSTPYTETLKDGSYDIVMPSNIQVGADIYNFKSWEDGSITPTRNIKLKAEMALRADYELYVPPPPPPKGQLKIHGFYETKEVEADVSIAETGQTGITVPPQGVTFEVDPGTYTIEATYKEKTKTYSAQAIEEQTTRVDTQFYTPKVPSTTAIIIYKSVLLRR